MARLGPKRIARLWIAEGGRKDKVAEAVATVLCESGGNTKAVSSVGARGMWQFMPGTLASDACAYSPVCSTREAVKLSKGGEDFSPWDCHPDSVGRSGTSTGDSTYESLLADLKTPLGKLNTPGPDLDFTNPLGPLSPINPLDGLPSAQNPFGSGGITNPLEGVKQIAAFFVGFGELVLTPEGWLRIAKLGGGALLIMWGLRVLAKESTGTDPVGAAKHGVTKAVEAAALIATVK